MCTHINKEKMTNRQMGITEIIFNLLDNLVSIKTLEKVEEPDKERVLELITEAVQILDKY